MKELLTGKAKELFESYYINFWKVRPESIPNISHFYILPLSMQWGSVSRLGR